jgi:hypothetical protein
LSASCHHNHGTNQKSDCVSNLRPFVFANMHVCSSLGSGSP